MNVNDGGAADDSSTANNSLVVASVPAPPAPLDLTVDHPSILRTDAAAVAVAASNPLHDSSSSGHVSPVDATNPQPNSDGASNPQQVALPPPGKRYRSTPAKTFQCKGFGDCRMVFSRSEHLARHIRYVLDLVVSSAHPRAPSRALATPSSPFPEQPSLPRSLAPTLP